MSARARACDIVIVLTHVVACDGQKAKLIAILEQIALLHNYQNWATETEQTECHECHLIDSCHVFIMS
jgi:hypothetical protein